MGFEYYHQDDPDGFRESFKEEISEFVKLMQILDGSLITANLPPVANSESLLKMTEDLRYLADTRYRKKNNLRDKTYDGLTGSFDKEDLLAEMKTLLITELHKVFPSNTQNND